MDKRIEKYIAGNKVLSIATSIHQQPWCASLFYAFDRGTTRFVFCSDNATRHLSESKVNPQVAGTINSGFRPVAKIRGIQFTGRFVRPVENEYDSLYDCYYARFPFARDMPAPIWGIDVDYIKMTDNTLGFGTKLIWERSDSRIC